MADNYTLSRYITDCMVGVQSVCHWRRSLVHLVLLTYCVATSIGNHISAPRSALHSRCNQASRPR